MKWWIVLMAFALTVAAYPATAGQVSASEQTSHPDSACYRIAMVGDTTSSFSRDLVTSLTGAGFSLEANDSLDLADLLSNQVQYALVFQDSQIIVGLASSVRQKSSLLQPNYPVLPDRERPSFYPLDMTEATLAQIPALLELTRGQVDTSQFDPLDLKSVNGDLLFRAVAEFQAFNPTLTDVARFLYESLLLPGDYSLQMRGWLNYNYAAVLTDSERTAVYRKADSLFQESRQEFGSALSQLAMAHQSNQMEAKRSLYEQIIEYCESVGDSVGLSGLLFELADFSKAAGQLSAAETHYSRAASIDEKMGDYYRATEVYIKLGTFLRETGHPDRAASVLDRALNLAAPMQSEKNLVTIYYQLGVSESNLGNTDTAVKHFNSAMDLMEILEDSLGLAKTDIKLGTIYLKQNRLDTAQIHYESALSLYESLNDTGGILQSHFNLGELTADQQRWEVSQRHFKQALQIARELNNPRLIGSVIYAKGIAHIKEGKYEDGYNEVKESFDLTNGAVYGTPEESRRFLAKLEKLVRDEKEILSKKKQLEQEL